MFLLFIYVLQLKLMRSKYNIYKKKFVLAKNKERVFRCVRGRSVTVCVVRAWIDLLYFFKFLFDFV